VNAQRLHSITLTAIIFLASVTATASDISIDMHQVDSGNFYVRALASGDIETDLLLDTGSSYVSLSQNTFNKISAVSAPRFIRHIYGKLANGKVEKVPLYALNELKLAENCVLTNIEVAVFSRADRDILGLNALAKLQPFTMQLTPAKLTSAACAS